MKVTCPQCNASYNIPENRVPERKAAFTCKRCKKKIVLNPGALAPAKQKPVAASENESRVAATPTTPTAGVRHNSAIVREFPETRSLLPDRYALDLLLPSDKKGGFKTRRNKLKLKLLGGVKGALDKMLDEGEQVAHLAGAIAYYPAELLFGNGWMTTLYNRYILVATTKRLIAINTDYKMRRPTHYFFQFPYAEIKKVSRGFFGSRMIFSFKRDKRRIFSGIKAFLSAELKKYIDSKINPHTSPKAGPAVLTHLCPGCFAPLQKKVASCPECSALFKSPRRASLRSLLLPGLGDFYLGHHFLGVCEIIGSLVVWVIVLSFIVSGESGGLAIAVMLLLFYNGMDGLLTLHMAKKGYSLDSH